MAQDILERVLDEDVLFLLVGGSVGIVAIIVGMASSVLKAVSRERSRREIAAYIAEGSMTPEQGERLLAAGEAKRCG